MKVSVLSVIVASVFTSAIPGATVNFSAGGPTDAVLFETASGGALSGGTMFAGTFAVAPGTTIALSDVIGGFRVFDTLDEPSAPTGIFWGGFENTLGTHFPSAKIYLIVVDTPALADANEFAVFSSTDSSWTFPSSDPSLPIAITLVGKVDQYFAGSADTITNPGGASGTFNSIQLQSTTPPNASDASDATAVIVAGQPGIEFTYPSGQATTVNFTLEESGTLLAESWTAVPSTPVVVSDDGTTQVIRILHPTPVTSQSKNFFRLVVSPL